jgi:hypothetical protein
MAIAIHSFKLDADGEIRIQHTFFGATKRDAESVRKDHARDCPHYGPALAKGETIDIVEELDALPEADEEELLEFLGLGDDEDEEDDEDK